MRQPFFRDQTKCWYVKDDAGRFVRLDPDRDTAFEIWHKLQTTQVYEGENARVDGLIEAFLGEIDGSLSTDRFSALSYYGSLFSESHGGDLVSSIKPSVVSKWLRAPKRGRTRLSESGEKIYGDSIAWSESSKRHAAAFLKRVWKWAHNSGFIAVNTLAELKLAECEYRDSVIDSETHKKLVRHCMASEEARPFALYLIASQCGARPQQIREVTASHVSADGTQWFFKKHKTSEKTGRPLIVYLPPCLQTLTRILVSVRPSGPLFRNFIGRPWKKDTVSQRMDRLRKKLNLPDGTVAYLYRHSMATNALLSGQSTAVVAQLLGHTDTRMVSKVYGHLDKHSQFLVDAASDAAKERISPG